MSRAVVANAPAPVGGWNARDPLDAMSPADAITLDNWFPESNSIRLRRGFRSFVASGLGSGAVETLIEYAGANARFLACANGGVFDVTAGSPVSLGSGFLSNRWQWVNFTNTAGRFVVMVNGVSTPQRYDGSTLASVTITGSGLTSSNLVAVETFRQRLFFAENGKLGFWYLATSAISGTASYFDIGPFCRRGGFVQAITTWTRDNGAGGMDDLFVVLTSEGEVLLFAGTDPSDAAEWALSGVFTIGKPVGRRCIVEIGADVIVICEDGFVPLSKMLAVDRSQVDKVAVSAKIGPIVTQAVRAFGANFGWQVVNYPAAAMAIFNVPVSASRSDQYVVNTQTGAWCRYLGQPAACWGTFAGNLYFGALSGGRIFRAEAGPGDNGQAVTGEFQGAFLRIGPAGRKKRFTMARPVFLTSGNVRPKIGVSVDNDVRAVALSPTTSGPAGAVWDGVNWNGFVWSAGMEFQAGWQNVSALGFKPSFRLSAASDAVTIALQGYDLMYEPGGFL